MLCPRCEAELTPETTVCPECGLRFAAPDERLCSCPACGTALPVGAVECSACGQSLCPECGTALDQDALACPACGVAFELVCPACGAELGAADIVCPRCGLTFDEG